ncbi:MAG: hypothetical protein WC793_01925 [Candidatus Paceibacterota bacterium]|jgi:hypothetical protein
MQNIKFKNKIKKFISALLIISIIAPSILFSNPQKAQAVIVPVVEIPSAPAIWLTKAFTWITSVSTVTNTSLSIKQWSEVLIKQALMAVARSFLKKITQSTVNWINSGFHGSPLFVENSSSFFNDIAKSEVRSLVGVFGYDNLKYPFGKDFSLNIINSYKRTLADNAAFSLSNALRDPIALNNYQNFNYSGWSGFLVNTQYPQNNYVGFQILATNELAARLQGTSQNNAQKITSTLQQGNGFLSPQTCPSNPDYNNGTNEFQKPSFDEAAFISNYRPLMPTPVDILNPTENERIDAEQWDVVFKAKLRLAKGEWEGKNTCPGGLVNTTPGSVVSNQIMTSLTSGQRQTELAAAMGNSLSAIFDALLNKFISSGLNSLSSTTNQSNTPDTWSYGGQTLSSPATGTNTTFNWNSVIVLSDFKKTIQDAINNTTLEIRLMDNPPCNSTDPLCNANNPSNPNNVDPNSPNFYVPGIVQLMEPVTQEAKTLDQCLPGPDKAWENRLQEEQRLFAGKFTDAVSSSDNLKVRASNAALKELRFAVDSFTSWINTKMKNSLPGATTYINAIKEIDSFRQQLKELIDAKQIKSQALDRLRAIADTLATSTFSTQPVSGSPEEKELIELAKQYDAIIPSISSTVSIENTRNELNTLKDQKLNMEDLNIKCSNQRIAAGWGEVDTTGKGKSTQSGTKEIDKFCDLPIVSGYSHGDTSIMPYNPLGWEAEANAANASGFTFRNPTNDLGNPGYTDLPMVNAQHVYGDISSLINIDINCNIIFKASPTDYSYTGEPSY